jgi:uncharacterized protein (DUF2336 family)
MIGLLQRVLRVVSGGMTIDYEESKRLVRSEDPADRRRVAADPGVKPEFLYYLATDPDHTVRVEVAKNEATPVQADLILAGDRRQEVRADLARKIASLAPGLTANETDRLRLLTYQVLETLIEDEAVRVRRVIAETLKSMPDPPREIIQRLARDVELSVAGPVLQYSPALDDEDLLDILRQLPIPGAAKAIALREGLGGAVSEEIGQSEDSEAIAALLSNPSAQIREDTLDRLIDRAPQHISWHTPLVERPRLSGSAALKLAAFVARDLLDRLKGRSDLPVDTLQEIERSVLARLEDAPSIKPDAGPGGYLEEAARLHKQGKLNESLLSDALVDGRAAFVPAGLTILSGLPLDIAEKIIGSHSTKGIVALAWKAGLTMGFAVRIQTVLGRIPVTQVLKPLPDGGFPLSKEALEWQIDFFRGMGGG